MNDLIKISILADTREQTPYTFDRWNIKTQETGLPTGDYSLPGFESQIAIERKTLDDLINCLMGSNRSRFEKELSRARSYELFAVIVEANLHQISAKQYHSVMNPDAVLQSIVAFHVRYGAPFRDELQVSKGQIKQEAFKQCGLILKDADGKQGLN